MKIFITYEFRDGPYGGVNQFLKALKDYFESINMYTENPQEADVILFNSSNATKEVLSLKKKYPEKIFIERLDGPTRLYNSASDKRDLIANIMNKLVADATIFQSSYSQNANYKLGLKHNTFETVIMNAVNDKIFNRLGKEGLSCSPKIRLIATSWSANWNKGFKTYQYLDNNLDFNKYEMIFIGNSPIIFRNIKMIEPLTSEALAEELRKSDIYITASQKEACSNALIEALSCGLPAIVFNDGGHPEIVEDSGLTFNNSAEIPELIEKMRADYKAFYNKLKNFSMNETGRNYQIFMEDILRRIDEGEYVVKKLSYCKTKYISIILSYVKIYDKAQGLLKRMKR